MKQLSLSTTNFEKTEDKCNFNFFEFSKNEIHSNCLAHSGLVAKSLGPPLVAAIQMKLWDKRFEDASCNTESQLWAQIITLAFSLPKVALPVKLCLLAECHEPAVLPISGVGSQSDRWSSRPWKTMVAFWRHLLARQRPLDCMEILHKWLLIVNMRR